MEIFDFIILIFVQVILDQIVILLRTELQLESQNYLHPLLPIRLLQHFTVRIQLV